jgi:hypothetical protein
MLVTTNSALVNQRFMYDDLIIYGSELRQ